MILMYVVQLGFPEAGIVIYWKRVLKFSMSYLVNWLQRVLPRVLLE